MEKSNEDVAITMLYPKVAKQDFAPMTHEMCVYFDQDHQLRNLEIQPCPIGEAFVTFGSPLEQVPHPVVVSFGNQPKIKTFTVQVYKLSVKSVNELMDEDPLPDEGPLHPIPFEAPRWMSPVPGAQGSKENGSHVDGDTQGGGNNGDEVMQDPEVLPMEDADAVPAADVPLQGVEEVVPQGCQNFIGPAFPSGWKHDVVTSQVSKLPLLRGYWYSRRSWRMMTRMCASLRCLWPSLLASAGQKR